MYGSGSVGSVISFAPFAEVIEAAPELAACERVLVVGPGRE